MVISSLHLEALVFKANRKEKFPKCYHRNMIVHIPIFASFHCNFAFWVKAFVLICFFYRFRSKDAQFFQLLNIFDNSNHDFRVTCYITISTFKLYHKMQWNARKPFNFASSLLWDPSNEVSCYFSWEFITLFVNNLINNKN